MFAFLSALFCECSFFMGVLFQFIKNVSGKRTNIYKRAVLFLSMAVLSPETLVLFHSVILWGVEMYLGGGRKYISGKRTF